MVTWQFNLFFLRQVIENPITFRDIESKASRLADFKEEHTNGLNFEAQLHSATHMLVSSSSNDSLMYSTMLVGQSFLGLSLILTTLLDSLAQLLQSRALCKTWLMSEKTRFSSFSLKCGDNPE
jgi:hypothetical protein